MRARMVGVGVGVATAAVICAVALPAWGRTAVLSVASYSGQVEGIDATVSFDAKLRNGTVRRVLGNPGPPPTGMTFENVPLTCDEGTTPLSVVIVSNLRVYAGRLVARTEPVDPNVDGRMRIRARFTDDYSAISGHVRAFRDYGTGATNCDSGRLAWTATVQPDAGSELRGAATSDSTWRRAISAGSVARSRLKLR